MKPTLQDRIFRRELGHTSRFSAISGLYGDRGWVDDLDIVNELGGHSGCVNALSWSSSGSLLASGSDDQHLNVHSYQPESSSLPFSLTTTVATGHRANIFSVKFMPHSNDRTLVTCAGDAEVRVFDIEHNGRSTITSAGSNAVTGRLGQGLDNMYRGVRYLSEGNTNARVYRSHADRVKRIVTESSPHLFLTCSEDGEVRQFDLRLPSSAYPPPAGGRGFLARRTHQDDLNVPPPLISYKRYHLDLNTISCSSSQPHYIALGGAHLHCFLHDRRMLGRDRLVERGSPGIVSPASSMSSHDNELMGQATQCVRKFAPGGRKRMRRTDNGHITACKISDANPNEMIVSYSGDHIYSFDLVRSPDARYTELRNNEGLKSNKARRKMKDSGNRKRKRKKDTSRSPESTRRSSKPRHSRREANGDGDLALRVRYENGQSEDIAMNNGSASVPYSALEEARESTLSQTQRRSLQIAKSLVRIRKLLFSPEVLDRGLAGLQTQHPTSHVTDFSAAIELAASCIPEMDEIIRSWGYPMNPLEEDVVLQQRLRANRDSSRRFVQAAGTLARVLGARLQTPNPTECVELFQQITPAPLEGALGISLRQIFSYEFLRAIVLWLDGGLEGLLQGFKRPVNHRGDGSRFPIPDQAQQCGIDEYLIPYLLRLARGPAIPNIDASRFERDEYRKAFDSESAAVIAFSHAIRMPLEDLSTAVVPALASEERTLPTVQDRKSTLNFWGFKVGRGVLMNAGEGINFNHVDTAFGGLGRRGAQVEGDRPQENTDPESDASIDMEDATSDAEFILVDDLHNEIADQMAVHNGRNHDTEDDEDEDEDEDNSEAGEDDEITAEERQFMFQSASDRGRLRESVEQDVPCFSDTRQYRGHCNVKTVKDCNFFGLDDEYVVSGSDSGHLFIWDKRTTELLNILEGDGEVVNVIQGHPYEPLLAVSGIDHTIKIFSPDARAQEDARLGLNLGTSLTGSSGSSSLPGRRRRGRPQPSQAPEEGLSSRKRMQQSYEIVSQNDVERQGGMRDAFITRGMLAQLAARLSARGEGGGVHVVGEEGEGIPVMVDDNCLVM